MQALHYYAQWYRSHLVILTRHSPNSLCNAYFVEMRHHPAEILGCLVCHKNNKAHMYLVCDWQQHCCISFINLTRRCFIHKCGQVSADLYMYVTYDELGTRSPACEDGLFTAATLCLSVDHLWHVVLVLSAIRQGEDRHELLEKTLLKLRVDQKGNRSTMCLYVCNDCAQKQDNKKDAQADWMQLQMLCWHWTVSVIL